MWPFLHNFVCSAPLIDSLRAGCFLGVSALFWEQDDVGYFFGVTGVNAFFAKTPIIRLVGF
jgi:hypothetical protein